MNISYLTQSFYWVEVIKLYEIKLQGVQRDLSSLPQNCNAFIICSIKESTRPSIKQPLVAYSYTRDCVCHVFSAGIFILTIFVALS